MSHQLKLLSFNIHKGVHFLTRKKSLAQLRDFILKCGAEVVCLQEIRGEPQRLGEDERLASQLEYLADTTWPHYAYGLNAIYESGHHGNAILSAFPILQHENIDISNHPLERRGLLHARFQPPGWPVPIHVLCLHFDLTQWGRKRQIDKLIQRVREAVPENEPVIVAGDFNDWSEKASDQLTCALHVQEAHKSLKGVYAKTFPSFFPILALDRIYVRGFEIRKCEVQSLSLSDHLAVLAEFALKI